MSGKSQAQINSIYAIRCKENGKVYVGRTKDVALRMRNHFSEMARGRKGYYENRVWHKSEFQKDYEKYGESGFEVYVLETNVPYPDSIARELYWINEYKAFCPQFGYNRKTVAQKIPRTLFFKMGRPLRADASTVEAEAPRLTAQEMYDLLTEENRQHVKEVIEELLVQQNLDDLEV